MIANSNRVIKSIVLLFSFLFFLGCNGSDSTNSDGNATNSDGNITVPDENGSKEISEQIKIYYKKRTSTSILAESKVVSDYGIEKVTLYCIDAYKYYEKNQLVVLAKYSKEYDPNTTNILFFQFNFENLSPQKSYILKVVAYTGNGELAQQMTTATLPLERLKESLNLSPYDVYHHTRSEYIFDLNKITIVDRLSIEEYDGDFELFDVYLKDINGNEILIKKDIVSSGDDVAKTHLLTNSNNNVKIKSVVIRPDGSAGGLWQFNSIVINP